MPFGHCLWQPYDESEREGFLRVLERIEDLKEISPSLQREQTYSTAKMRSCQALLEKVCYNGRGTRGIEILWNHQLMSDIDCCC
jgi:hypothetical protein